MNTPFEHLSEEQARPWYFFGAATLLVLFFAVWSYLALGEGELFAFDQQVAQFWKERGEDALWPTMVLLTDLGSIATLSVLGVMGSLWQASHRRRFLSIAWLAVLISGALLNGTLKTSLDRPRPPELLRDRAVLQQSESYPSGHAMGSVIGYGFLGYILALPSHSVRRRVIIVVFLGALTVGISFSRVYLRAHWFSDVIGGYTMGLAWLFFCIGCLEWRRWRLKEMAAPIAEATSSDPAPSV